MAAFGNYEVIKVSVTPAVDGPPFDHTVEAPEGKVILGAWVRHTGGERPDLILSDDGTSVSIHTGGSDNTHAFLFTLTVAEMGC